MQSAKQLIVFVIGALALVLAVVALVELYTPPKVLAIAPVGLASRITLLERTIAAQSEALRRYEAINPQALAAKFDSDINALRASMQNTQAQTGSQMAYLSTRIARLEQANRNIPTGAVEPGRMARRRYVIAPGDTLASIARKIATSEDSIIAANQPGFDFAKLHPGEVIFIPRP